MSVITRFAPSPTGYLHLGSARTALFCWAFAKKHGGKFLLRVEDTDLERSTQASKKVIFEALEWLELDWQEGPYFQTERLERYQEVVEQLIAKGHAYRCTCSKERLETLRKSQQEQKLKPKYDGCCRDKSIQAAQVPFVIRFKTPQCETIVIDDEVKGQVRVKTEELDDFVLVRGDGMPTYNFAVVVDDVDMKISHVIRGDDHLNNTPRQIPLFHALGAKLPIFAHIPMILGEDGKRLSKRHGAVSVLQYREQGVLPEALLNYLARLGFSDGDRELFTKHELGEIFDLKKVQKAAAVFNPQKLLWVNQQYLQGAEQGVLTEGLKQQLEKKAIDYSQGPALKEVVEAFKTRAQTFEEMADKASFCFVAPTAYDPEQIKWLDQKSLAPLCAMKDQLSELEDWCEGILSQICKSVVKGFELKFPALAQPLRVALTGSTHSPSIDVTMYLIGKKEVLVRLQKAIEFIEHSS